MAKNKDIPGQVGLDGNFVRKPDKACEINAKPLDAPQREHPAEPIRAKRRKFNLVKMGKDWVPLKPDEFTEIP